MNVADAIRLDALMPDPSFEPLWTSIVAPADVKSRLLHSALLAFTLRQKLPFDASALHGMSILVGPPGTGKTTLARGLAQRVALTLRSPVRLLEVDPHGLMSAEHGQSQRKVMELLNEEIPSRAQDGLPTIVLLDEAESLAVARSQASLGANPADVHRATDAVLTALDRNAREYPHIFTVATSNFTDSLDEAFVSRADVVIQFPRPNAEAASLIVRKTLNDFGDSFPAMKALANDAGVDEIGAILAGRDGRGIRKLVTEALMLREDTVLDPEQLTVEDLRLAATGLVVESMEASLGKS